MKWLLWKDYRHNRLIVFTTLALLLTPYLIGIAVIIVGPWIKEGMNNGQAVYWRPPWRDILYGTGAYSIALCQVGMALLGGNAIAGERADRSSQFLYSLPVTRRRLLASKLLLVLIVAATVWLVNATVFSFLNATSPGWSQHFGDEFLLGMLCIATTGLTFFCVAWCLSAFIASPAFNVCCGLLTPLVLGTSLSLVNALSDLRAPEAVVWLWYVIACLMLSASCFATGTWQYLRRIEP